MRQTDIEITKEEQKNIDKILRKHRNILYKVGDDNIKGVSYNEYDVATAMKQYSILCNKDIKNKLSIIEGQNVDLMAKLSLATIENIELSNKIAANNFCTALNGVNVFTDDELDKLKAEVSLKAIKQYQYECNTTI